MKIIKKGNIYRKAGWFKEHEFEMLVAACAVTGFWCFILAMLIRG